MTNLAIWDNPKNIDLLRDLHAKGLSFAQIATEIGQGVTRNAVIGKAKRLNLPGRENRYAQSAYGSRRTVNGETPRAGNSGSPGQAKANVMRHRVEGRRGASGSPGIGKPMSIKNHVEGHAAAGKIAELRRSGMTRKDAVALVSPGRPGVVGGYRIDLRPDYGVDVTSLIAFEDRRIGQQCAWIPGDPLDGAMCCGKPVKEGTQWCPEHYARVYPAR